MRLSQVPGLKTTSEHPYERCAQLARHGYQWLAFQAQNDTQLKDYDLTPAKSAGFLAGVWGVSYSQSNFPRDGKALAEQARKLGAWFLIADIEFAAKDTRNTRGLKPYVDGVRAGGWGGPVHLSTMGPPSNPDVNDYAIDLQSILETDGDVFTQAYANETDTFLPELAVKYWTRVGVPRDRLNCTISLYPAESDKEHPGRRYDGQKWVELLTAAGVKQDFSIFMAEAATDPDLEALDVLTMLKPPEPVDVAANRDEELRLAKQTVDYWRANGKSETTIQRQRQTLAWRVLNVAQTTQNLDAIKAALDTAGAPKP